MSAPEPSDLYSRIVHLCARYSLGVDTGDAAAVADCFTPDGALLVNGVEVSRGARSIAERLTGRATPGVLHTTTGVVLRSVDGDRCAIAAYFFLFDTGQGLLTAAGRYEDVALVAEDSVRWLSRDVIWMWRRP